MIDTYFYKTISFIVRKMRKNKKIDGIEAETDPNKISGSIVDLLTSMHPVMICRFGATELMCLINYLGVKNGMPNLIDYLKGRELDWWWKPDALNQIQEWSGFFPANIQNVESFCELMIDNIPNIDILASWLKDEAYFKKELESAQLIQGLFLDPFWSKTPWTKVLKGKKVLVIHPFQSAIESQYQKRELLFENQDVLPEFKLVTIKAVQSLGGESEFESWFQALDYMQSEIDKVNFDICLIGAGAYGFPLAAYVKSIGRKAVHVGGSLQLLFGIKGKRWENPDYGFAELGEKGKYAALMNEYWVYPGEQGKPKNADSVENACYW